jgi:hypothetical protein
LRSDTPAELLRASRALLDGARPEQIIPGASAEKGVHISHSVVIHPTARITPPVVIGSDCSIGPGAHVGPYVAIGERTILGDHTTLENAVVFPGTYVGPHLELTNVVVDHSSLAYRDGKGSVPVPDSFLLSTSDGVGAGHALRLFFRRFCGAVTLFLTFPLILFFFLIGKLCGVSKPIRRIDAVSLPAPADPALWKTFPYYEFDVATSGRWGRLVRGLRLTRLPTLCNVISGAVAWIGLRPLTPAELSALPTDWRQIYRSSKIGIIRLSELDEAHAGEVADDQIYSSEAYYAATDSFKTDMGIFWRAIWRR